MSHPNEMIQCIIINAPDEFKKKTTPFSGLEATVDVHLNGIIILKSKIGEITLKFLNNDIIAAGSKVFLHHERNSDLVNVVITNKNNDIPKVRPIATSAYSNKTNPPINEIKGHHTVAEGILESAISEATKSNAYDIARSICLIPDTNPTRSLITSITFLLTSFVRNSSKAWAGGNTSALENSWDHVMKERTFIGPDAKQWKSRQFPIHRENDTVWAIFATPLDNTGLVSRFIVEIPTTNYGLVQIKAFGQGEEAEIVIITESGFGDNTKAECKEAMINVAKEIDAEISINFVNDPTMLANLSQARRTNFEV